MKHTDWVGRLVEFRGPKTLGESYAECDMAYVYEGRIQNVYVVDNVVFAKAIATRRKGIQITHYNTNPDPNWTAEQYNRKKHHRAIFRATRRITLWGLLNPDERSEFTIKLSGGKKWKPHKF